MIIFEPFPKKKVHITNSFNHITYGYAHSMLSMVSNIALFFPDQLSCSLWGKGVGKEGGGGGRWFRGGVEGGWEGVVGVWGVGCVKESDS